MIRYSLPLPKYRLNISLVRRRHFPGDITLKDRFQAILAVRKGNKISRVGRHFFEHRKLKALLGGQLALAAMFINALGPALPAAKAEPAETTVITAPQVLTTEAPATRYPVDEPEVSQGYSFFHPALDLRGPAGTPIHPALAGKIIYREFSHFGYGNHLVITHANGYQTLYAHLSAITVREGDQVDTKAVIGLMGATGHATGNHLHFELYQNGRAINPKTLLGNL